MTFLSNSYSVIAVALVLSMNLSGMQNRMLRVQQLLTTITKNDTLAYDPADLVKYLQMRVENSSATGEKRIEEISSHLIKGTYVFFGVWPS